MELGLRLFDTPAARRLVYRGDYPLRLSDMGRQDEACRSSQRHSQFLWNF